MAILFIIFVIIAYLVGSLSSAVIVCKLMNLPDPRTEGSNNPGATNVLRIGGRNAALITLIGDFLKGFLPVFIANLLGLGGLALGLVAVAALLGHIFPLFFNFKGGKGVATFFGALLAFTPIVAILAAIVWIIVAYFFRYASLASMCAAAGAVIFSLFFAGDIMYILPILIMGLLLIWRHHENIDRLRKGTESKIDFNFKKKE